MKIQLKKPYEFEGKTYKDLEFDLEGLTGVDVSAAKRDWLRSGGYSPSMASDVDFGAFLAAKAAKLPMEFMQGLPAKDYCAIGLRVCDFLSD